MMAPDPGREQLAAAMNRRRAALHIKWDEVARRGGISIATLRRARKGEGPLTLDTCIAIDRGLSWEEGHTEAILAGAPTPAESAPTPPAPPGIDPKRWRTYDAERQAQIIELRRLRDQADAALRRMEEDPGRQAG